MPYTTKQLYTAFGVSHQTVKNWAIHFKDYLSPTATPEKERQRIYTDEDVRVLELVNRLKKSGQTYEMIGAALGAGQRGELPDMGSAIVPISHATALAIAAQRVADLEAMLLDERLKNARLEGKVETLEKMLDKAQEQVYQLRLKLKFE